MELWTSEHIKTLLPSLVVMLIIGAVLRVALKNKPVEVRLVPLKILAVVIVVLEIGKQVLSANRGYDLYHLPFHFCSLFIFALPAMAFYKGKHCQAVRGVGAALCAALMLLMLIYPNLIYGGYNINAFFTDFFSFHTVAFHNVVMLFFVLTVALQIHTPAPKGEPKAAMLFTVGFCVVSATMAQLLKTNYANYYSCNIPPLEALRVSIQGVLGYAATQLLYILIVSLLNILFVLGSYWVYRGCRALVKDRTAASAETHV